MENMIHVGYILLIMCSVLILIAMVTQLHKKELKESFYQQLGLSDFSKKLLQFDESMIPECPPITPDSRTSQVQSKSEKKMKKKPPGTEKKFVRETEVYKTIYDEVLEDDDQVEDDDQYDQEPEECEMVYSDTYRYGELENATKDRLLQGIQEKECTNPLTSCKLEFDYQQVRKFTPIEDHRPFCEEFENIVDTYKYKCPNTRICDSACDGITFNGMCYRAISMEFFLRNKSWRIRDPQSRRFINDDRDQTLQLLENPKSFKFRQHRTGFFIVQNNDDNRRWGFDEQVLKNIRDPRNHVYVEMYTIPGINNRGLIKVIDQRDNFLGWLSIQELRLPGGGFGFGFIGSRQRLHKLQLTPNPIMEWQIIRA
jgi:hypothetical protein